MTLSGSVHVRGWVRAGDYYCAPKALYHVEHVADGHALVEDCASGELLDMPLAELLSLTPVRAG
jgi:hypothetical protein